MKKNIFFFLIYLCFYNVYFYSLKYKINNKKKKIKIKKRIEKIRRNEFLIKVY